MHKNSITDSMPCEKEMSIEDTIPKDETEHNMIKELLRCTMELNARIFLRSYTLNVVTEMTKRPTHPMQKNV